MDKFSKLKPKAEFDDDKDKVLYQDEHFQVVQFEDWSILKERKWSCSWRYAGGIIAHMRREGDYIDWYCAGDEGTVTGEIKEDFKQLGWTIPTIDITD